MDPTPTDGVDALTLADPVDAHRRGRYLSHARAAGHQHMGGLALPAGHAEHLGRRERGQNRVRTAVEQRDCPLLVAGRRAVVQQQRPPETLPPARPELRTNACGGPTPIDQGGRGVDGATTRHRERGSGGKHCPSLPPSTGRRPEVAPGCVRRGGLWTAAGTAPHSCYGLRSCCVSVVRFDPRDDRIAPTSRNKIATGGGAGVTQEVR